MGGNSEAATLHNLELENVNARCTLISQSAAVMSFADNTFDVIVSNLCIHNMYDRPTRTAALHQIVRVLKPGGIALISDYKRTGEYAAEFRRLGLQVLEKTRRVADHFSTIDSRGRPQKALDTILEFAIIQLSRKPNASNDH